MEFDTDEETRKIQELVKEFFERVLGVAQPPFVSDYATVWDVSTVPTEKLLIVCSEYYGKAVSKADLNQPLYKLLPHLNEGRAAAGSR